MKIIVLTNTRSGETVNLQVGEEIDVRVIVCGLAGMHEARTDITATPTHHNKLHDPFYQEWVCTACGARKGSGSVSADWRWNGQAWEHSHGGQCGHFMGVPANKCAQPYFTGPQGPLGPQGTKEP